MKRKLFKKTVVTLALASTAFTTLMPAAIYAKDSAEQTNEKEETVYIINDASGKVEDVVVSGWLKNNAKADILKDKCNLTDVINVKGKQTFTSVNGVNEWQAKGKDIYYQGSASNDVPVGMKVTYKLDGKEMSAADMLNKSGKVEIHVQYYNNAKANYEGKEYSVPMLMATGMILDTEKFANVSIDNGKVINDGTRFIVAGFGMPGLNEELALSEEIIPSSFTISADVKKFSTSEMMTYAGNDMLNELDLSSVGTIDELMSAVNKLGNASTQLVNGTNTLADGVSTLASKSTTLVNGVGELDTGASTLSGGLSSLYNGLNDAKAGSALLVNGLNQLNAGVDKLMASRAMIASGLDDLAGGMDLANANLKQSIEYNYTVNAYLKGLQTSMNDTMKEEEKVQLAKTIAANEGSIQIQEGIQNSLSNPTMDGTLRNGVAKLQAGMATEGENTFGSGLNALKAALAATYDANGQSGLIEGMNSLQAGISSAYEGSLQLSQGAKSLSVGTSTLNNASGTLVNGINELNKGAQTLKSGMSEFDATGIQKLVNAFNGDVKSLTSKLNELMEAGKGYNSFSGLSAGMSGSVKYIIKTAGIE